MITIRTGAAMAVLAAPVVVMEGATEGVEGPEAAAEEVAEADGVGIPGT